MRALGREILDRYKTARTLVVGGTSLRGLVLYPVRHRLPNPRHQIDLKTGLSMVSPLDVPLVRVFEDIWVKRCYTRDDFKVTSGDTVVDIGASIGVFSIWAATRAQGVRVIAVEPSPRIFNFLVQNLSRNRLRQVVPVQAACGGEGGGAILYSRGFEGGNSMYARDNAGRTFRPLAEVLVQTLDEIFRRHEVAICNLLKLSCVGAEYEVLFNASEDTLRRISKISMEYHLGLNDHCLAEMVSFLEQRGFGVNFTAPYDDECGYLFARQRI